MYCVLFDIVAIVTCFYVVSVCRRHTKSFGILDVLSLHFGDRYVLLSLDTKLKLTLHCRQIVVRARMCLHISFAVNKDGQQEALIMIGGIGD